MLQEERLAKILDRLSLDGRVLSAPLAAWLGVSEDTIRRDLAELSQRGQLRRVHGGAVPVATVHPEFKVRSAEHLGEKDRIAEEAVRLVRPGQLIFLDAGTTVLALARHFARSLSATVVTHSAVTATTLADWPNLEVLLIGGKLFKPGLATIGPEAVAGYQRMHADICFLGICALHAEFGLTELTYDESLVKQAMIRQSSQTVALGAGDKLGVTANFEVAPAAAIDRVLTDATAPGNAIRALRAAGVGVEVIR